MRISKLLAPIITKNSDFTVVKTLTCALASYFSAQNYWKPHAARITHTEGIDTGLAVAARPFGTGESIDSTSVSRR